MGILQPALLGTQHQLCMGFQRPASPTPSLGESGPSTSLARPILAPAATTGDDPLVAQEGSNSGSFGGKVKCFTERILKKAASPLLHAKVDDSSSAKLPLRSRRIAANPLSKVPVVKRGEILVMQRLGLTRGRATPSKSAHSEYDSMFVDKLSNSHEEAMRELFPENELPRRSRGWRATRA